MRVVVATGRSKGRRPALVAKAAWVVLWVMVALAAVGGWQGASLASPSPYYLVLDPLPLNPAQLTPRMLAFSAGPLAAEVESSNWTLQQIADFAGSQQWQQLPPGGESLSFAGRGGLTVAVMGAYLSVGVASSGQGQMTEDFIRLMQGQTPGGSLEGNYLRTASWGEAAVRASLPVPLAGRFLGLRGLRVGGGLRLLQGQNFLQAEGSGTAGSAKVVSLQSKSGTGTALDVGVSAEMAGGWGVDLAYLGVGEIRWTDVREETVTPTGTTPSPAAPQTMPLPATLFAGVRWRPLGPVPLELAAGMARVGVNGPGPALSRLNAEARFNLWAVRSALGAAQDEGQPARIYARFGLGPLTVGLLNLEEAFRGTAGRSVGLAAQLSFGI